jgi:hypothetical protein
MARRTVEIAARERLPKSEVNGIDGMSKVMRRIPCGRPSQTRAFRSTAGDRDGGSVSGSGEGLHTTWETCSSETVSAPQI